MNQERIAAQKSSGTMTSKAGKFKLFALQAQHKLEALIVKARQVFVGEVGEDLHPFRRSDLVVSRELG